MCTLCFLQHVEQLIDKTVVIVGINGPILDYANQYLSPSKQHYQQDRRQVKQI